MITYHANGTRPEIRVVEHEDKAPKRQYDFLMPYHCVGTYLDNWESLVEVICADRRKHHCAVLYSVSLGGCAVATPGTEWAVWRHE